MTQKIPAKFVFSHPIHFLSFGFGSGLANKAPGTFGTLAALPIYFFMVNLPTSYYLIITLLLSVSGIFFCDFTAKKLVTSGQVNDPDHGGIVWDEICGFLITMVGIGFSWTNLLFGFILFRLFDIFKPWPICWLDRQVKGGFGIMVDDLVAGFLAMSCLQVLVVYVL